MDGDVADLPAICDLAEKYEALVLVDESHATGFTGPAGAAPMSCWASWAVST
jgi:glycine C-acetyltransferase